MKMQKKVLLEVKREGWLTYENPTKPFEQAVEELKRLPNKLLEVDWGRKRVKVLDGTGPAYYDVFKCEKCPFWDVVQGTVETHEATCVGAKAAA